MMLASYTRYTRVLSKTNCPVKLLHASFTSVGYRESQGSLDASLPEEVSQLLSNLKAHSTPGAMDSNLKNT